MSIGTERPASATRTFKQSRVCTLPAMPADDLPVAEFAFPGPLRDQLVAAILAGEKTTTTGLVAEYEHANDPLPVPGLREVVVDSGGRPVAVIETTAVRVVRLADVDLGHVLGEGEGFASVAEWRAGHERFWHSADVASSNFYVLTWMPLATPAIVNPDLSCNGKHACRLGAPEDRGGGCGYERADKPVRGCG
jgi:uncharacterized protein YhfF